MSAEKRAHRSLPELCHTLLGHPEAYTSHTFKALYITNLARKAAAILAVDSLGSARPETSVWVQPSRAADTAEGPPDYKLQFGTQELDYMHRGAALEFWPLYFYIAGVQRCSRRRLDSGFAYALFESAHPDAPRLCQRISLRQPWAVPLVAGLRIPRRDRDPELYSLCLLLLLKPWKDTNLMDVYLTTPEPPGTTWAGILQHFCAHLHDTLRSEAATPHPRIFSPCYWAQRCLTSSCNLPCMSHNFDCLGTLLVLEHFEAVLATAPTLPTAPAGTIFADIPGRAAESSDENEDALSASDIASCDDDAPLPQRTVTFQRTFQTTWLSFFADITNPFLDPGSPTNASFALAAQSVLRTLQSPADTSTTHLSTLQPYFAHGSAFASRLREDCRQWLQACADDAPLPLASTPTPFADLFLARHAGHPLAMVMHCLSTGACNTRDGTLNHKQALLLILVALQVQAAWLSEYFGDCIHRFHKTMFPSNSAGSHLSFIP